MRKRRGEVAPEMRYNCPHTDCLYSEGSERYFTKKFNLKQHLLKVHTEKAFACKKCHIKTFASEKLLAYHEKNCGIDWSCSCGLSYDMRETLLTHVRRTMHKLPENIQPPKRKLENSSSITITNVHLIPVIINTPAPIDKPVVSLLNTCSSNMQNITQHQFRRILPKPKLKVIDGVSRPHIYNSKELDPIIYKVENTTQTDEETAPNYDISNKKYPKKINRSVETQTARRSIFRKTPKKSLQVESRASQCYPGQKSRRRSVRLESIETQTTEIILDKMKQVLRSNVTNKKSYMKPSLVDESSNTSDLQVDVSAQSVLSCLDILLNSRWSKSKSQCSSGTQTSPRCKRAREMRDSEVGTDKRDTENDFEMLSLLATVCQSLASEMISKSSNLNNYLSEKDSNSSDDSHDAQHLFKSTLKAKKSLKKNRLISKRSLPSCSSNTIPVSLNIETQTCDENDLSTLLSNMETQTTLDDELFFPDMELSDIQTQTPWTDFLDFYNNLDEGQLSAEIQTDITGSDFVSNLDSWNETMTVPEEQLANVIDTETQTHLDYSPILEFTSSYTQTLDEMCDFFGIEEKIDLT